MAEEAAILQFWSSLRWLLQTFIQFMEDQKFEKIIVFE
jgi:hypothetical protein